MPRHPLRSLAALAALAALASLLASAPARAADPPTSRARDAAAALAEDATHGRIEGDLGLVLGVGATAAPRGLRAAADLRLRYLDTIGAFVTYEDAALFSSPADPKRLLATGLEIRPLFLARWLKGRESGNARADLLLDSLGLEVAALFMEPIGGSFGSRPGVQLGLGLELPILPRASGPWIGLHGGVRFSDIAASAGAVDGATDRSLYLAMTFAWHQIFGAHVVDMNDRAVR